MNREDHGTAHTQRENPLLQPLVVGLGRAGAGLHLKVLSRARSSAEGIPCGGPPVACDPRPGAEADLPGVTVTTSIAEAARLVSPPSTVVHVCLPPVSRPTVIEELAELGFRNLLVEKPLASDRAELENIQRLRRRHDLRIMVVSHWLTAELTRRLRDLVRQRRLGSLVSISVRQHKPRFLRSLTTRGHPSAFDVEIPHSLGVLLDLAGPARVLDAGWTDLRCEAVVPRMGSAWLVLRHQSGVSAEIVSDLTSPVQERSITLEFDNGWATGHYPLSERDDHAQLVVVSDGCERDIFRDDALTAFMRHAYRNFHDDRPDNFGPHCEAVRLLCDAKEKCRDSEQTPTKDANG
jgi:predicted dehydrogenase